MSEQGSFSGDDLKPGLSEIDGSSAGVKRSHEDENDLTEPQQTKAPKVENDSKAAPHDGEVKPEPTAETESESGEQKSVPEGTKTSSDSAAQQNDVAKEDGDEGDGADEDAGSEGEGEGEDNEEEEDEEDEEEEPQQKKKRRRANQFLDIEAEVDDEEEDELDEDDEEAELLREQFIADDHVERDGNEGAMPGPDDDRLHRQYDQRRQQAEDQDAEELAETLKQRYRKTHTVYRGDTTASGTVSQKLLMPSIDDPPIYAIRCSPGKEKDLVRKLYEKKLTLARSNRPLDILSVFQRDAFRGYIYIEAKKPEAIERALTGMVNVYAKQRIIVPVKEYPDLLKQVKSSDVELVPGIYVRITRGKYKGDLAIVDNLSENGLEVRCKLVPRLDYGKNDDFDADGRRIKSKAPIIPRLFNEMEARTYDAQHLQPGRGPRSYIYRGEEYTEGFLFKDFRIQFIQTQDVRPRLEELDRFQTGNSEEDGLDLAAVAASLKGVKGQDGDSSTAFQPGDKVEIRRGEQAKTVGRVLNVSLNEVKILVLNSGDRQFVDQELTVPASDLRKVFSSGDHVKVTEGVHSDETGLVIKIDGDSVVFLSDQTNEDVRVFANYLIKATDTSTNNDMSNSQYDIKDLVQLNASTVGVIVKAEKGLFGILTSDGRLLSVKPSGIASKIQLKRREQVATDKNGLTIKVGDTIKEVGGDKKKEGVIVHIFKNALFVESHELQENLGIFVTNALNVSTVSTKDSMISRTLGPDLSRMNPNVKLAAPIAAPGLKTRVGGRDKLLSKEVIINNGNHKGLKGVVVETDDIDARVELHTKSKKIKVNKTKLSVLIRGESIPYLRFIGASDASRPMNTTSGPAFSSGARSAWGGATPSIGGAASAWGGGGKTPSANAGGASAWGSGGGASAWASGGTSAWGSGGGASSWKGNKGNSSTWGGNNTGGTSAWGSGGGNSAWGSGGGNSAWGGGNSTWGGNGKGGASSWGNRGGASSWGSNGKAGNSSAWGNRGGSSSWGNNQDNNSSTWGRQGNTSSWGNGDTNSGWGKN